MDKLDGIPIQLDPNGFVWFDGVKLPVRFIPARRSIEFYDKDKRRSDRRGSRVIEIPIEKFTSELLEKVKNE